jgi:RND family efflux transporter MFP subunit
MDRATRDLQVAKANELRATQAVSETEAQLAYTTIHAVRSGRIVDRFAEPGDIARPGEPILVLYDATSLRLEAPVMEHLAVDLKPGDTLNVYIDAVDQELEATIDEIVPQADAPSRSFLVKASLPRSENLYEGMFGRLRIPAGERRHLCLATDAVVRIGQLEFVDVVLPDETIERRLIKSGQLGFPGRQEVLSGLQAGERVILQHQSDSAEAQSVEQ